MFVMWQFLFIIVFYLQQQLTVELEFSQANLWNLGDHSLGYFRLGC
jgi:hypothetical protein